MNEQSGGSGRAYHNTEIGSWARAQSYLRQTAG